jgi:photosystem II stability/assembly factor-like uncharacterized protein
MLFQRDTWAGHYSYPSGAYHSICFVDSVTGWVCGDNGLTVHTDDDARSPSENLCYEVVRVGV